MKVRNFLEKKPGPVKLFGRQSDKKSPDQDKTAPEDEVKDEVTVDAADFPQTQRLLVERHGFAQIGNIVVFVDHFEFHRITSFPRNALFIGVFECGLGTGGALSKRFR